MNKNIFFSKRKANRIFVPANSVLFLFDESEKIAWIAETDSAGYKILKQVKEVRCV